MKLSTVHSFGVEDVDRHVVIWRKEFAPCEDELEAIKQGIEYDPVVSAREKYEASKRQKQEEEEEKKRAKGEKKFVPRTNYKAKVYINESFSGSPHSDFIEIPVEKLDFIQV